MSRTSYKRALTGSDPNEHYHIDGGGVHKHSHPGGSSFHYHMDESDLDDEKMGPWAWVVLTLAAFGLLVLLYVTFIVLWAVATGFTS